MNKIDPTRNYKYRVELNNITQGGFSEVAIAESTIEAIEYREGTDAPHVKKLSGLTKYGNITLKKGVTTKATELFNWFKEISSGQIRQKRQTVTIVVEDESGKDSARFVIEEAWPVKYDPSDLSGKGNEVLIETLELANEGIERTE